MKNDKDGKGKVWSNRNYGADKKRQRKQNEKQMLETRIVQLERVLREEHGIVDLSGDESLWNSLYSATECKLQRMDNVFDDQAMHSI